MSLAARLLVAGGVMSMAIGLLHVGVIVAGPPAYAFFGAGEKMTALARGGSPMPALITAVLVGVFIVFGLYALSGAGAIRRLLLLRTGLLAIGGVYTLRGLSVIPQATLLATRPELFPLRYVLFSAAALVVGLCYLGGTVGRWKALSTSVAT